ncbi:hypothetical protein NIES4073_44400 [Kalymmatonema gypsitolerans NIES-4073]|nr:hypothetical protein NIES4073_44400 [Scytonema sp. NIES-4073]
MKSQVHDFINLFSDEMKKTELIRNFFILIILQVIFPYLLGKLSAWCQKYLPDFIRGLIKTYQQRWYVKRDQTINALAALGIRAPKLR